MSELRFLRTDGEYLVLESANGESFRVALDDSIRRALKPQSDTQVSTAGISPREIQVEVRGGAGIAELAARTGASLDYIQKFAAPVIDELAHVVQTALSVRLTVAGDRYNDTIQIEFGELIAERLATNGITGASWSSSKSEHGPWMVTCDLGESQAIWSFDIKRQALSPENELAVQLSATQTFTDAPIPKLKSMPSSPALATPAPANSATASVPAAFAKPKSEETSDLGDTMEFEGVIPFGRTKSSVPVEPTMGENLANTADLLDALRKKRLEREALENEESPTTFAPASVTMPLEETQPLIAEVESEAEASQVVPEEQPEAKPTKKGRASVPSWNDIVFGTKSDD